MKSSSTCAANAWLWWSVTASAGYRTPRTSRWLKVPHPPRPEEERIQGITLNDLMAAGLLKAGDLVIPADLERDTVAEITDEALIALDDHTYDSPQRAARADGDEHSDGWEYWALGTQEPPRTPSTTRRRTPTGPRGEALTRDTLNGVQLLRD